ncbi:Septum formation topological specificity factor MinE [Lachnospiraceae bacterium XBB1006]|nr:Septum formation topological specificity factor MinE [Lachnospiraceae bacterium XBB1006]
MGLYYDSKKRIMRVLSADRVGSNQAIFEAALEDVGRVLEKYYDVDEQRMSISVLQDEETTLFIRVPVKEHKHSVK